MKKLNIHGADAFICDAKLAAGHRRGTCAGDGQGSGAIGEAVHEDLRVGAGVNLNFGGNGRLMPVDLGSSTLPSGLSFTILEKQSAGPISGTFVGLAEGAEFDLGANRFRISYIGGNGNDVTLFTVPRLPGDYNGNGKVDAADYVVWRKNLGSATSLPNDATAGVGPDDYTSWRANFGQTVGIGSGANTVAAVPESTTHTLLLMGTMTIYCFRAREVCKANKFLTLAQFGLVFGTLVTPNGL